MPRDWNNIGSSEQDSDDQQNTQPQPKQQPSTKQQKQTPPPQKQQPSQVQHTNTQSKKRQQEHKQRPKFISDDQLIEKIKNKQVQERRKIKIVNCKSQQLVQKLQKHSLISYFKEIKIGQKPAFYIASFKTQQDLIQFIKQKIQNKYRFFLHQYIKTARDIQKEKQRQEKRKQRNQEEFNQRDRYTSRNNRENDKQDRYRNDREDNRYNKGDRQERNRNNNRQDRNKNDRQEKKKQNNRGRNRPEYDQQSQQETKQVKQQKKYEPKRYPEQESRRNNQENQPRKNQYQSNNNIKNAQKYTNNSQRDNERHKNNNKQTSNFPTNSNNNKIELNYQINKNQITIKSNKYSKNRIVDDILTRNISDKWNKIKIYVKKEGLDKVLELIELIYKQIQYGLKQIPDQSTKTEEQVLEVILQHKSHLLHPNSQFKLLTDNQKKYFEQLNYKNKYIISKEFSVDQYVKQFKYFQKDICKKWKQWLIKAQDNNIPTLLKLSWKLRKQLFLNIGIKVGSRKNIPFAILEINPETDKDKRPKVDASFVNSYLTN